MHSIIFVAGNLLLVSSFVICLSEVFPLGVKKLQSRSRAKEKAKTQLSHCKVSFGFLVRGEEEFLLRT
jgi:hypothetical protein